MTMLNDYSVPQVTQLYIVPGVLKMWVCENIKFLSVNGHISFSSFLSTLSLRDQLFKILITTLLTINKVSQADN